MAQQKLSQNPLIVLPSTGLFCLPTKALCPNGLGSLYRSGGSPLWIKVKKKFESTGGKARGRGRLGTAKN
jgi:hypothetical protein